MCDDNVELFLQVIPLKNSDHKRISRNKNNPLQRIRVSPNTSLATITSYIRRLAGPESDESDITLHASYLTETVQLPLTMTVAELLLVTHQNAQAEVRYGFVDKRWPPARPQPAPSSVHFLPDVLVAHRPPRLRPPRPGQPSDQPKVFHIDPPAPHVRYPAPSFRGVPQMDSMTPMFHSGFSLFSNSFGIYPTSIGTQHAGQEVDASGTSADDNSISLRRNLEMEINRHDKQ
jgi:hypothetical protein